MARLDPTPYPMSPSTGDYMADYRASEGILNRLIAASADLVHGQVVGAVLRWQRCDGYAIYIVTDDRPLTVQHIDHGDAYTVEAALIRGLNVDDVLDMLDRQRKLHALFSKGNR